MTIIDSIEKNVQYCISKKPTETNPSQRNARTNTKLLHIFANTNPQINEGNEPQKCQD